jgi:hypothetical protein
LITNLNNLNYQTSSNYNTINQSSAKDILYELKQYENFAANSTNHLVSNHHDNRHHARSYSNGTNYSQNILNYNNSYYKINNINNYNYIKSTQSPTETTYRDREEDKWCRQQDKNNTFSDKMERDSDNVAIERSHLVKDREANGHNVTIHNFTNNNVTSHTTVHAPQYYNNGAECEECCEEQTHQQEQQPQQNNSNPFNRSQHFTQVSSSQFHNKLIFKVS